MIEEKDYIDGNKFESIADIGFGDKYTKELNLDLNKLNNFIENFKENRLPVVYVDSDRVRIFFGIVKNYEKSFILLSHNGDATFTQDDIDNRPKCVKKWFGQNINAINTADIVSLPIGLERPHWSKNRYGIFAHKHNKIFEYSTKEFDKNKICYINFNPNTNKEKRQWIEPYFRGKDWVSIRMGGIRGNIDHYLKDCKESHFVLCPDGNGIDCHRNWEMLYLGVTPIIESSYFHNNIYGDLPVLIINNFKELNESLLSQIKYNNEYNMEKLKFSYWKNKIK